MLHFETERFILTTKFDMEQKLDNTENQQHDAKLPVGSSALSDWNEKFKRVEKDFKVAFANLVNSNEYKKMIDGFKRIGAIR